MDQNRRNAEAWAKEWYIRRKNQRLLMAVAFVVLVAAIAFLINFIIVHVERTTFKSEEEMRKAMSMRTFRKRMRKPSRRFMKIWRLFRTPPKTLK